MSVKFHENELGHSISYKIAWASSKDSDQLTHIGSQITALDKALFSIKKYLYFSYFSTKTYVVGTH